MSGANFCQRSITLAWAAVSLRRASTRAEPARTVSQEETNPSRSKSTAVGFDERSNTLSVVSTPLAKGLAGDTGFYPIEFIIKFMIAPGASQGLAL